MEGPADERHVIFPDPQPSPFEAARLRRMNELAAAYAPLRRLVENWSQLQKANLVRQINAEREVNSLPHQDPHTGLKSD
jgi:hypothetical protein